jgi:hypothetical protein
MDIMDNGYIVSGTPWIDAQIGFKDETWRRIIIYFYMDRGMMFDNQLFQDTLLQINLQRLQKRRN